MLKWNKEKGYGYYPVEDFVYDDAYFEKYRQYGYTDMGKVLTEHRIRLLLDYIPSSGNILDIGIGAGNLIEAWGVDKAWGYDVNPKAIKLLKMIDRYCDFWNDDLNKFSAITFFDSFEHIKDTAGALERIAKQIVIISMPVFRNLSHILQSKHFRPDEHYHYFTMVGLMEYMAVNGFRMLWIEDFETKLGREDILTFVFRRD